MSKTFKHVHRFDSTRSLERKSKANKSRRQDDIINSPINLEEELTDLEFQSSKSKPLSDKREWG